jgi:DNA-damage-inducible protein J
MAKTAIVRARVEPELKADAEAILKEIGLTLSDAINILFRRVKSSNGFPVELRTPNAETLESFRQADEYPETLTTHKTFTDFEKSLGLK